MKSEQTDRPSSSPFGTSGIAPADSGWQMRGKGENSLPVSQSLGTRAGAMPEASGDFSSGTFDKYMFSLLTRRFGLAALVFTAIATVICVYARPVANWDYRQKFEIADLVIIARPIETEDTSERIDLPGISVGRLHQPSTGLPVIGINTRFAVTAVRKGDPGSKEVVMHHYRLVSVKDELNANAANLVTFDPKKEAYFILFLKRESDGRYAPLDQTDPGSNSVEPVTKGQK